MKLAVVADLPVCPTKTHFDQTVISRVVTMAINDLRACCLERIIPRIDITCESGTDSVHIVGQTGGSATTHSR
jgi:hypothetical protein